MSLENVILYQEYEIENIITHDNDLEYFLFTLGCYEGGRIEVVNKLKNIIIVLINGARYSMDINLASCIKVI